MPGTLMSLAVSVLTGFLLAWALVPLPGPGARAALFRLSLGTGLGIGINGVVAFLVTVTGGPFTARIIAADVALLLVAGGLLALALRRRARKNRGRSPQRGAFRESGEPSTEGSVPYFSPPTDAAPPSAGWLPAVLAVSLALLALLCTASFTVQMLSWPHGQHDAMSTWNLRARQLAEYDPRDWRQAFASPDDTLMHGYLSYYPPLHSIVVMRGWKWAGSLTQLVPILNAACFTLAAAGLLMTSLSVAGRGRNARIAGIVFLGMPNVVFRTTSLYADIPTGFFLLASASLMVLHDRLPGRALGALTLSGLAAGLALFTKQEGFLFSLVAPAVFLWTYGVRGERDARVPRLAAFAAGFLPLVALFVCFKTSIAHSPGPDYTLALVGERSVDLARHGMIVRAFFETLFDAGKWSVFPAALAFYLLLVGSTARVEDRRAARVVLRIVVWMMAGFYLHFLLVMWGLPETLYSTFDRGMLQLWPMLLLGLFLRARTPEEAQTP